MSLNDPRWGGKDQEGKKPSGNRGDDQGPPDLEEVWRDLNRRLTGMFGRPSNGGRGNQGGGDSQPPLSSGQVGGGVGLILGAVLALWLATGFYSVDASQQGVVLRFGKLHEITGEGLQWRLPYPIDTEELVNVTGVRTVEVGYRGNERSKNLREALMLTDDENIINIQFAVQYTISDATAFVFNDRDPEEAVRQAAETSMREVVGKSKMDFVLYEGREEVAQKAQNLMQSILDRYKIGIQIGKVTLQNAQPPEQVQEAFNDAVKAGQNREQFKNEGQAYANDVIPKASGTAARLIEEAEGYAARVVSRAEGDASRFKQVYTEYSKAPDVTRTRLYLDTMQQVYDKSTKVIVDTRGNGNLLYLPLDKLMQAAGAPAAAGSSEVSPPTMTRQPEVPALNNNLRSREGTR